MWNGGTSATYRYKYWYMMYLQSTFFLLFLVASGLFSFCVYRISIVSVVSGTLATGICLVVIACSLESFRPGIVQGCKTPNGEG